MARFGMVIDTAKCVGCMDCVVACKTENDVPAGFCRDWISDRGPRPLPRSRPGDPQRALQPVRRPAVRGLLPHRRQPRRRAGRLVLRSTHEQCIGCKACLASCPYDARFIHPDGYADKCTFCLHRVKAGLEPACVAVCPTRCMHFGDLDDPHSEVSRLLASRHGHALQPEAGTGPRIHYLT